jgi:putative transcriptional regulator
VQCTTIKLVLIGLQDRAFIMTKIIATSIQRDLGRALAYVEGTVEQSLYAVHIPEQVDVRAIRVRLKMTQQQFAVRFGFSINTLRHWEQGRRVPEGPTRAYLLVIDREPEAVQKALRIA